MAERQTALQIATTSLNKPGQKTFPQRKTTDAKICFANSSKLEDELSLVIDVEQWWSKQRERQDLLVIEKIFMNLNKNAYIKIYATNQ